MPKRIERPNKDDPITAEWAQALVDTINDLLQGPEVMSPLAKLDGAVYLAQDYQIYEAITTGVISARVGTQWGSGNASFNTVDAGGVESTWSGNDGFTAWNLFGASISSGIRIIVAWMYGKWTIIGGDCSGVA